MDIKLKLREAVLDHDKATKLLAQIQKQLLMVEGRRDAFSEVWLDGRDVTLQEAWDKNLDELREDKLKAKVSCNGKSKRKKRADSHS